MENAKLLNFDFRRTWWWWS